MVIFHVLKRTIMRNVFVIWDLPYKQKSDQIFYTNMLELYLKITDKLFISFVFDGIFNINKKATKYFRAIF